jgi:hypothetical protein
MIKIISMALTEIYKCKLKTGDKRSHGRFIIEKMGDIFSDDELKDLKAMQNQKSGKADEESKRLIDIAKEELNKLSNKTDIKFAKQNDPENKSVTYAFGIGKNFSISHTSGKQ